MSRRLLVVLICLVILVGLTSAGMTASGPNNLYLKEGTFDPATAKIHSNMSAKKLNYDEPGLFIAQFNGPILEEYKSVLAGRGVSFGDYLPDFAFIIRATPKVIEDVSRLDFIRTIIRYEPVLKISKAFKNVNGEILTAKNGSKSVKVRMITFDKKGIVPTQISLDQLTNLALDENITYIEEVHEHVLMNDKAAVIMNASTAWNMSLKGSGQIVGICDTGLDTGKNDSSMHLDFQGRITSIYALGRTNDASDTHGHGTHVAGSVLGNGARSSGSFKGLAYEANVVFQSVLDSSGGLGGIPSDLNTLFSQAYNDGARIHTNSWGVPYQYGGNVYDAEASQVDQYMWNNKDMLVLFAAGNDGPTYGTVTTPGTAKNCLTVGASENNRPDKGTDGDNINQIASFSSRGWCAPDNRIKPDVVAPGTWILSTKSSLAPTSNFWATYNTYYAYMGGTSMATPLTAGAATLVRQYYVSNKGITPKASLIKATMINGATDMGFGYTSRDQGWGRVNLTNSLDSTIQYVNEAVSMTTGGTQTYNYTINSSSKPFKVTLAWTDYPASESASTVLVNDLDLEVTSPGGTVYYGNDFTSPYNTAYDRLNNVENVFITSPATGTYTVKVKGYNIPNGPQPFALVVSGGFGSGGDTIPPTVSITSPTNGATVSGTVAVNATASDNIGVSRVEFYVDGTLKSTDTTSPYSYSWDTTTYSNTTHNLVAKAFDAAENYGTSSTVSVTVNNPGGSTATITEPFTGSITSGASKYYYIDVTAAGTIDLSLTWDTTADLDLYLYNPSGTQVASGLSTSKPEVVTYNATTTGRYQIKVYSYSGSANSFRLDATHKIDTSKTLDVSTNDSVASGAYKEYNIYPGAAGTINLSVSWTGTADIDLYLYNSGGTQVASATSSSLNPETISYTISAGGTYKVRVKSYSGAASYTVRWVHPK